MLTQTIYFSEDDQKKLRELRVILKNRSDSETVRQLIDEEYKRFQKYKIS